MSAIQLLEKIGANADLRYSKNDHLSGDEIQNLIDVCPDIVCVLVPAEDEDTDTEDDDKKEEVKTAVNY